jgi:hypothetical protein
MAWRSAFERAGFARLVRDSQLASASWRSTLLQAIERSAPGAALRRRVARAADRRVVRASTSAIDGSGLFLQRFVAAGEVIGELRLGPPGPQGVHTLLVGSQHREVDAPWRFLNHSCTPSAVLAFAPPEVSLIAARDLPPRSELTIDYALLPEKISKSFACRCAKCERARQPAQIGGASSAAREAQHNP